MTNRQSKTPKQRYTQRLAGMRRGSRIGCVGLLILWGMLILQTQFRPEDTALNWLIGAGIIASGIFYFWIDGQRERVIQSLLHTDDIQMLPLVLESLNLNTPKYRKVNEEEWQSLPVSPDESVCLCRLLPQLDTENLSLLYREHAPILYSRLDVNLLEEDSKLLLTLLESLTRTEDTRALPHLQKFSSEMQRVKETTRAQRHRWERLWKRTQTCLSLLTARSEQERSQQTLLRASHSHEDAANSLVRPTQVDSTPDTQNLLRPTTSEVDHS